MASKRVQGRPSDRQVSLVRDYVEAYPDGQIELADLASVAGLSRFNFSRAFRAAAGKNAYAFVLQRRIARAADLLKAGNLPLEIIASAAGYRGAPQSRRAFREVMSVTPNDYRKECDDVAVYDQATRKAPHRC
ncbi:MAG: AraC family transcriptional regulator [Rhizorhabdus sp.]|nr:MAG: AraC family transcriptional regulator [Rhizorhabdus sp.]